MPRRAKNGRFSRTTTTRRRRSKPKTNLTNLAVSALVANAITTGAFNANLLDFITGQRDGKFMAGGDGSYRLTLPELLGMGKGGFGGNYSAGITFTDVMQTNLKKNGAKIVASAVLIPMAANVVTKLIRKPVILPMNRALKMTGLDVKV